jgi:ABC-type polar amino acid transport system ATPase subunit
MQDSLRKRVTDLSGGQQQRVAIARSLANKPEVLLLDEPTSALDPQRTREVGELLRELASARTMTLVVVTHDLRLVREVADRVLLLEAGRTAFLGSAEEFFAGMHPAVQRFLVADRVGMGP